MSQFRRRLMMSVSTTPPEPAPEGVVWYESLVSDGVAYINTQIVAVLTNSVEIDFTRYDVDTSGATIFGSRSAYASNFRLSAYNNIRLRMFNFKNDSSGTALNGTAQVGARHRVVISITPTYVSTSNKTTGASEKVTAAYGTGRPTHPMYLFGYNNAGAIASRPTAMSLHSFKVYNGDELTHHFRPCTYLETPGLWETVSGTFFGNSNSEGEFTVTND